MPESSTLDNNLPDFTGLIEINTRHPKAVPLKDIRLIISRILADHHFRTGEISVAIVDDPLMHELNRTYLAHDYPTDVLSFVLDRDEAGHALFGEIIVSADTAASMAHRYGHPVDHELLLYVIHGALHLVDYDDTTEQATATMIAAETKYLNSLGISGFPDRIAPKRGKNQ